FRLHKPLVYQEIDGVKHPIAGRYVLLPAGAGQGEGERQVGVQVAVYDPTHPLVIDPVLRYSTYLGGSSYDVGNGIAVDANGNASVAGQAGSDDSPTTPGAFQPTYGGGSFDAFVTKLHAIGAMLLYSTYLGGFDLDFGYGIAVDAS